MPKEKILTEKAQKGHIRSRGFVKSCMKKQFSKSLARFDAYSAQQTLSEADHLVDDARTLPIPTETRAKTKKPSGKAKTVLLTAAIAILCFSLTVVAADLLGNKSGIVAYTSLFQRKKPVRTYYAVYATHSSDMALSYKNASAVREEGGAGYVMKEGSEYYVVLNVYESKADAKKVKERKENYGVLEIEIPTIDFKKQKGLAAAESSKDLYIEAYRVLYEAANDLASGKYQEQDMLRVIRSEKEKVSATESVYAQNIKGTEDRVAIEYKVILAEIRSAFENLENNSDHLVSDARYYAAMIVRSFALFAQKYAE